MNVNYENVKRALKDEPLIMSSWKCKFGWHVWTKWTAPKKTKDQTLIQSSECIHCGVMKIRGLRDQNRGIVFDYY